MNKESQVYILTRTHNRPKEFALCAQSIERQTVLPNWIIISDDPVDTYINTITIPHQIFRPKRRKPRWWIRHHNPFNDYFNQALQLVPDNNFIFYLDDDDMLLDNDFVKLVLETDTDILIGRFKMGANHNFRLIGQRIERNHIGSSCFAVRSEIARQYSWKQKKGGDFFFIQQLSRCYSPVFIELVIGGVQTDLNRSWSRRAQK